MSSVNCLTERAMMGKTQIEIENQFFEWLAGRGKFPYYQDNITVPFPMKYDPNLEEIIGKGKGDPDIYGYPNDK